MMIQRDIPEPKQSARHGVATAATRLIGRACAQVCAGFALLAAALAATAVIANEAPPRNDLIGTPAAHLTVHEDTLLDLALRFGVGYVEMLIANPGIDPWLPGANRWLRVPSQHLLPDAPRRGIVINLPELRLYYFAGAGAPPQTYPISIGDEGKGTPLGATTVQRKQAGPAWIPTRSIRAEHPELPRIVRPGPDNPMGAYALYLGWHQYAIHGTNQPFSIGRRGSHGCIRLYPDDIKKLFRQTGPGTPVTVVNQPLKTGWRNGELYLEAHPELAEVNAIEAGELPLPQASPDADKLIKKAAGNEAKRIDWDAVHAAILRRDGMPLQITR